MTELVLIQQRFVLLEDQVKDLSVKLSESNKWQSALEKWLLNTFKLDVSELVRIDKESKNTDQDQNPPQSILGTTDDDDDIVILTEPPTITNDRKRKQDSPHISKTDQRTQARFLPPQTRIISKHPSPSQSQMKEKYSIENHNRRLISAASRLHVRDRVKAKPSFISRGSMQISMTHSPIDSPVSITPISNIHESSSSNNNFTPPSTQILILPSDTAGLFRDESVDNGVELHQYETEINDETIVVKEEPIEILSSSEGRMNFSITDQYSEPGNEDNSLGDSSSTLPVATTSQNKFECDDFYTFNLDGQGVHSTQSEPEISYYPKHIYENYMEVGSTTLPDRRTSKTSNVKDKGNPNKKKRKVYLKRKWNEYEAERILKYMKSTIVQGLQIEKPNVRIYCEKMLQTLRISQCNRIQLQNKVRNLREKYFDTLKWKSEIDPAFLETSSPEILKDALLKRCPYWDLANEIWGFETNTSINFPLFIVSNAPQQETLAPTTTESLVVWTKEEGDSHKIHDLTDSQ